MANRKRNIHMKFWVAEKYNIPLSVVLLFLPRHANRSQKADGLGGYLHVK